MFGFAASRHDCLPIISNSVSCTASPCEKPLAQLLPAPPPSLEMKMFSGLNRLAMSDVWIPLITLHAGEGDHSKSYSALLFGLKKPSFAIHIGTCTSTRCTLVPVDRVQLKRVTVLVTEPPHECSTPSQLLLSFECTKGMTCYCQITDAHRGSRSSSRARGT